MSSGVFYIYEHWRPDTGACFYVGKGKRRRAHEMKNRNAHHKAVQAKVLAAGGCIEVRVVLMGLTEAEAYAAERVRIAYWREQGAPLTNQTDGGDGTSGWVHTPSARSKISAANRGLKHGPCPDNVRAAVIKANTGNSYRLGKTHTPAARAKLAAAATAAMGEFLKYAAMGPAASSKRVVCVDTGRRVRKRICSRPSFWRR